MGTPNREPQEYSRNLDRNIPTMVLIFLLNSYYILGVPCLGFPLGSLYYRETAAYLRLGLEFWGLGFRDGGFAVKGSGFWAFLQDALGFRV